MAAAPRKRAARRSVITTADLFKLRILSKAVLSPDEQSVVFAVQQMDEEDKAYYSHLYVKPLNADQPVQYTFGKVSDGAPAWSPDGSQIAFISTRDKKQGIYVIPAQGGAERKIVEIDGGISSFMWAPEGNSLILAIRYNDSHFIEDDKKKKEPPVFRHITRLFYRLDGMGFLPEDRFQVYELDVASAELTKLTSGKRDNQSPCVSADGKWIVYVSNRHKNEDIESERQELFVIPRKGGKERHINAPAGPKSNPKFSPDGKLISWAGHANPDDEWGVTNHHIWTVGFTVKQAPKDLLAKFDRMVYDQSITDSSDVHAEPVYYWSKDSKRIYFLSSDTGNTNLYYVPRSGGTPTRVFRGDCHLKHFSMAGNHRICAMIWADINNPGEVVTCPAQYQGELKKKVHTDLNPWLRTERQLGRTKAVMFKSFDGTDVQGFLLTPPNFNPRRKYPAILEIHGGPRTQYAFSFFHEMQYLAANGYVVFYTNPRGGSGRGETWAAAISGGWGDLDYKDCMAATDYLEKLPYVDKKRLGVTGGSYGGYMTNWIIGHTNRFKAAVTQRSVVELHSFFGSSDFGYSLNREFGGYPWVNPENYKQCSPLFYSKNVKTPVLILHNEKDLRCNIEQAEQMFAWLKVMGKTVEMVRFPDEPHGLSRMGRPDRRIARLEWILKWFERYLKR